MERSATFAPPGAHELRICEFNVENLFVDLDYYGGQSLVGLTEKEWRSFALPQLRRFQKPLSKLWGLARAMDDIQPDIVMLTEVGGENSLHNFNRHFLRERYEAHFIEGNSRRNIDLAYLVRRGLAADGITFEARSNRDLPIEVKSYHGNFTAKFSRDVAELRLHQGDRLAMIILLVHLKSMLSSEGDYRGKDFRTAEAIALVGLYHRRREEFAGVPILVGGDFNSNLGSTELALLQSTDLRDMHDLLQSPPEQRVTLVHFDAAENAHHETLDYLLLSPDLVDRIVPEGSGTYRYRGFYGIADLLPQTSTERLRMPSDHYPQVLTLRWHPSVSRDPN